MNMKLFMKNRRAILFQIENLNTRANFCGESFSLSSQLKLQCNHHNEKLFFATQTETKTPSN